MRKLSPLILSSQPESSLRNGWKWCHWTSQSVNNQAFSFNYDVWRRSNKRTTSSPLPFTKKIKRQKFLCGPRKWLRNQMTSSNSQECLHTRQRLCRTGWTPIWVFNPKNFDHHSHQIWTYSILACKCTWRKCLQDSPQQHKWAQDFCEPRFAVDEKRLHQEGLQVLPALIRECYWGQK